MPRNDADDEKTPKEVRRSVPANRSLRDYSFYPNLSSKMYGGDKDNMRIIYASRRGKPVLLKGFTVSSSLSAEAKDALILWLEKETEVRHLVRLRSPSTFVLAPNLWFRVAHVKQSSDGTEEKNVYSEEYFFEYSDVTPFLEKLPADCRCDGASSEDEEIRNSHRLSSVGADIDILSLLLDVGRGLHHLHSLGVVHGDVSKLESIFIRPDGTVCLGGFAKASFFTLPSSVDEDEFDELLLDQQRRRYVTDVSYSESLDEFRRGKWKDVYALGVLITKLLPCAGGAAGRALREIAVEFMANHHHVPARQREPVGGEQTVLVDGSDVETDQWYFTLSSSLQKVRTQSYTVARIFDEPLYWDASPSAAAATAAAAAEMQQPSFSSLMLIGPKSPAVPGNGSFSSVSTHYSGPPASLSLEQTSMLEPMLTAISETLPHRASLEGPCLLVKNEPMWRVYRAECMAVAENCRRLLLDLPTACQPATVASHLTESETCLLPECRETFLFHGTSFDAAKKIAQEGFDLSYSGSASGAWFGMGLYFTDDVHKALSYAKNAADQRARYQNHMNSIRNSQLHHQQELQRRHQRTQKPPRPPTPPPRSSQLQPPSIMSQPPSHMGSPGVTDDHHTSSWDEASTFSEQSGASALPLIPPVESHPAVIVARVVLGNVACGVDGEPMKPSEHMTSNLRRPPPLSQASVGTPLTPCPAATGGSAYDAVAHQQPSPHVHETAYSSAYDGMLHDSVCGVSPIPGTGSTTNSSGGARSSSDLLKDATSRDYVVYRHTRAYPEFIIEVKTKKEDEEVAGGTTSERV